jgi:hypothetical protein
MWGDQGDGKRGGREKGKFFVPASLHLFSLCDDAMMPYPNIYSFPNYYSKISM